MQLMQDFNDFCQKNEIDSESKMKPSQIHRCVLCSRVTYAVIHPEVFHPNLSQHSFHPAYLSQYQCVMSTG